MDNLIEYMKQGHHPYVEDPKGRQIYLHYDVDTDCINVSGIGIQTTIGSVDVPQWLVKWFASNTDNRDVEWMD